MCLVALIVSVSVLTSGALPGAAAPGERCGGSEHEPNNKAAACIVDGPVQGALDPAFDRDLFRFEAESGATYDVTIAPRSGIDPQLTVYTPGGDVAGQSAGGGPGAPETVRVAVP